MIKILIFKCILFGVQLYDTLLRWIKDSPNGEYQKKILQNVCDTNFDARTNRLYTVPVNINQHGGCMYSVLKAMKVYLTPSSTSWQTNTLLSMTSLDVSDEVEFYIDVYPRGHIQESKLYLSMEEIQLLVDNNMENVPLDFVPLDLPMLIRRWLQSNDRKFPKTFALHCLQDYSIAVHHYVDRTETGSYITVYEDVGELFLHKQNKWVISFAYKKTQSLFLPIIMNEEEQIVQPEVLFKN